MIIDFEIHKTIELDELWEQADYLEALDLSSENDRAYILVSAVAIEDQIFKLIKSLFPLIDVMEDNKDFTFSFKINLLKSFDLYNPKVVEYAHLIRKIRNEFAHNLNISEFENLAEGTKIHISQCINYISPQREFKEVKDKVEAMVKWLFWELKSLNPYTEELRVILTSVETKSRLKEIKNQY